ncbi:LuxR family transcriptional regulator [Pseudomonas sp. SDI]|uniref:LuxR family transcriptional regulator n=1 Tax=Pseudomonas sp. SDI TaxID=2170734 RepID=UPI000DE65CB4|nr:LuxR family transcriptional regulator [Pseudomonas sp. SDI]PWB35443.1 LuxR family transcriptional regulator [Pseudomonas sp. SDI]
MSHWKPEVLQELIEERNQQRAFDLALTLTRQLGMGYLAFGTLSRQATLNPQLVLLSNYPPAWAKSYEQNHYVDADPVLQHCRSSTLPLLWEDEVFNSTPALWKEAQENGLRYGWSVAAHDARGNASILSVARSTRKISRQEFYDKAARTMWLCNHLHSLMTEHLHRPPTLELSKREIEVLKWSAEGKTADDIACILTLSKSTVNFHIRSCIAKTETSNKTAAAVAAARFGLL